MKKVSKKKKTQTRSTSASSSVTKKKSPQKTVRAGRKATAKVKSAAAHIKKTTKKMVDDVFLKLVGMKVLARAQEITQSIKKEKRALKKGRR